MPTFKGYLMKAVKTGAIFPNKLIQIDTFGQTPNVREEIKADRDDYTRDLIRITAQGTKTNWSFSTVPLNISTLYQVQKFFTDAEVDHLQRKIQLEYWNDETLAYKTGYFYRPDITYTKNSISDTDIDYDPITIELVEY